MHGCLRMHATLATHSTSVREACACSCCKNGRRTAQLYHEMHAPDHMPCRTESKQQLHTQALERPSTGFDTSSCQVAADPSILYSTVQLTITARRNRSARLQMVLACKIKILKHEIRNKSQVHSTYVGRGLNKQTDSLKKVYCKA